MEQERAMAKQMVDLQRSAFDSVMNSTIILWNQTESAMNTILNLSPWVPENGRKALLGWVEGGITGLQNFKNVVDESYSNISNSIH